MDSLQVKQFASPHNDDYVMILCIKMNLKEMVSCLGWCSDALIKNWKDSDKTMLPIYKELAASGLRIWIFR